MRPTTLLISGVFLAAGFFGCASKLPPVQPSAFGKVDAKDELSQRIAKDPVAVLREGLDRYNRDVSSYTCTLYKQERIDPKGSMGPRQKMLCKFMDKPFSVVTDTVENPIGARKTLYVEGRWDNRMLVQPSGLGSLLGFILVEPRGDQARANTLRFIDQFGLKRNVENMIRSYTAAHKDGILTSEVLGAATVEGREVIVCDVKIAEPKPTGRFEFPHVRVWLDRKWLLPIAVDTWDAEGIERGHYSYADVNFNADLTAKDFTPEANGMKPPK
jgi:hypothetical protein